MMWSAARVDLKKISTIFRFLRIYKKIAFYPNRKKKFAEVHCMKYRIRWENKNFDDMGTLINNYPFKVSGYSFQYFSVKDLEFDGSL